MKISEPHSVRGVAAICAPNKVAADRGGLDDQTLLARPRRFDCSGALFASVFASGHQNRSQDDLDPLLKMSRGVMSNIAHYRRLAAEAREAATAASAQDIKDAFEQLARANEQMALDLEQKHRFGWWRQNQSKP